MMARAATPVEAVPARHVPVLLSEMLDALGADRGGVFVDGTFGAGGYTQGILAANRRARVVAIDRDPDAIAGGAGMVLKAKGRLVLVPARFGDLDRVVAEAGFTDGVDGVVLDIGVSSMQLDEAERGFSFRRDGPLDMRMERDGDSAADLVNRASEAELADIFFHFGEERRSRAVARARDRAPPQGPHRDDGRARRARRRPRPGRARRHPPGDPRVPGRCASPSTTSSASSCARSTRPSACCAPAGGSRS